MDATEKLVEALKELMEGRKVIEHSGTTNLQPRTWVYGNGMFSYCGGNELLSTLVDDDVMSSWLGVRPSVVDPQPNKIIGYVAPYGTAASDPSWNDYDEECGDCPGVEWGKCETISCFGAICRSGSDLSLLSLGVKGCDVEPTYIIKGPHAGTRVTDERTWQLALAGFVLRQDFERMNIVGNSQVNPMDWDGLQRIINTPLIDYRTGSRCQDAEPTIYDWASAAMSSNICDIITAIVRRLRMRGRMLGGIQRGDMVLVMTSLMRDALIDFAGCGCGPCAGSQYNEVNVDPLAARQERARLANGGTYGMGMFEVNGIPVDIVTNDWIPQTSIAPRFCSDIYVLTRRAGGQQVFYMEHQDFATSLAGVDPTLLVQGARITDGGRFLVMSNNVNVCFNEQVYAKNRFRLRAPWLQGRITNVCAPFDLPPITPIPGDAYFFAGNPPTNVASYATLPYSYSTCGGTEDILGGDRPTR